MGIEWGAKIEVVGDRPAWLASEQKIMHQTQEGLWIGENGSWRAGDISPRGWIDDTPAIRLPADHFAYLAIAKGYEPWGGGERAPADWDGEHGLFRDGTEWKANRPNMSWKHPHTPSDRPNFSSDIIGYRKRGWTKGAPFEQEAAPPALAQMTTGEARMLWARCATGDLSTLEPHGITAVDAAVRMLNHLGFIRPDRTPLEQFLAEHPEADPATADLAIKWARAE